MGKGDGDKMAKNEPQDESFTDFCKLLATIGGGTLAEKLSEKLNEVTRKAQEHGKSGEIVLKLKVKPAGSIGTLVDITGKVTAKIPDGDLPGSILFAKDDGTLHVEDPRQLKLKTIAPVREFRPVAAVQVARPPAPANKPTDADPTTTDDEESEG